MQKNVGTTVKWLQIVALQKFFLRLLSCQTIGLMEFLVPKFNSNYYYGKENQKNSTCHSNQVLIENVAADIDFYVISSFLPHLTNNF